MTTEQKTRKSLPTTQMTAQRSSKAPNLQTNGDGASTGEDEMATKKNPLEVPAKKVPAFTGLGPKLELPARHAEPILVVQYFSLSGDRDTDQDFMDWVYRSVEAFHGTPYLCYAHKPDLYQFEIGGEFGNKKTRRNSRLGWWNTSKRSSG